MLGKKLSSNSYMILGTGIYIVNPDDIDKMPTLQCFFIFTMGRFFKKPVPGDLIFFKNSQRIYHTGIVRAVDGENVYTIECNTSSAKGVVENGGCVAMKSYSLNYSKIASYGRPV